MWETKNVDEIENEPMALNKRESQQKLQHTFPMDCPRLSRNLNGMSPYTNVQLYNSL